MNPIAAMWMLQVYTLKLFSFLEPSEPAVTSLFISSSFSYLHILRNDSQDNMHPPWTCFPSPAGKKDNNEGCLAQDMYSLIKKKEACQNGAAGPRKTRPSKSQESVHWTGSADSDSKESRDKTERRMFRGTVENMDIEFFRGPVRDLERLYNPDSTAQTTEQVMPQG